MRETNETSKPAALEDHRPLADSELDAVTGGAGKHIMDATIETFGGGTTGGGGTSANPASAWNDCLHGYGFPSMA